MEKGTHFLRIEREKKISFAVKREEKSAQDKLPISSLRSFSLNSFGLIRMFIKCQSFTTSTCRQYCVVES